MGGGGGYLVGMPVPQPRQYYVTAIDGPSPTRGRVYRLAGPYSTRAEAERAVSPAREAACDFNRNSQAGRAWFMAYGVSRGPAGLVTALGAIP